MSAIKIEQRAKVNGKELPLIGFMTRSNNASELSGPSIVEVADDMDSGTYESLKVVEHLDTVTDLLITSDQDLNVRLNGATTEIPLLAGGWLMVTNANINATPTTNVTVNNTSGVTAKVTVFAAGT